MRIKNHFLLKLVFTSLIFLIAAQTNAAETFSKLEDCRVAYLKTHTPTQDFKVVDEWCRPQMNPVTFCADRAFLNEIAINSYTKTAADALKIRLNQQCNAQALPSATGSTGVAGTAVPVGTGGVGSPACVGPNAQTCLQNLQANQVLAANQQQRDIAQQQQQPNQPSSSSGGSGGGNIYSAASQALGQVMQVHSVLNPPAQPAAQPAQTTVNINNSPTGQTTVTGASASGANPGAVTTGGASASVAPVVNANAPAVTNAQTLINENGLTNPPTAAELRSAATDARQVVGPNGESAVSNVEGTPSDPNTIAPGQTVLTTEAQNRQRDMDRALNEAQLEAIKFVRGKQFETVMQTLESIKTKYQKFIQTKNSCVKNAERTNKLCLEGTSPGMKAAKALVDYSGPVLSAIGAAQKTCSSTKKIMNLAAMGMTLAKTACVASKALCDGTCTSAETQLREIVTEFETASGQINTDAQKVSKKESNPACIVPNTTPPAQDETCFTEAATAGQAIFAKLNNAKQIIDREVSVEPGTTQTMVASCDDKKKDILLMVLNIGGVLAAKVSAGNCEKKLATNTAGGAGANVSTADYCAKPENTQTQFCKCQGNLTSPECSSLAGLSNNNDPAASQMGANLKPTSGLSSFAGGGNSGGNGSGSNFNLNGGLNGSGAEGAGLPGLNGTTPGGYGAAGGSSGGGGAGSANAGVGAGTANTANVKPEDKKWSFGSFASALSNLAGGKGGGSGGSGNGSVNSQQQQQAIARKIASDKYAAEVSSSSGLDNFSKVKKSYIRRADTFMVGP